MSFLIQSLYDEKLVALLSKMQVTPSAQGTCPLGHTCEGGGVVPGGNGVVTNWHPGLKLTSSKAISPSYPPTTPSINTYQMRKKRKVMVIQRSFLSFNKSRRTHRTH